MEEKERYVPTLITERPSVSHLTDFASSTPESNGGLSDKESCAEPTNMISEIIRVLCETGYPEEYLPSAEYLKPLGELRGTVLQIISGLSHLNYLNHELPTLEAAPELARVNEARGSNEKIELLGNPEERTRFYSSRQDILDAQNYLEEAQCRASQSATVVQHLQKQLNEVAESTDSNGPFEKNKEVLRKLILQRKSACQKASSAASSLGASTNGLQSHLSNFLDQVIKENFVMVQNSFESYLKYALKSLQDAIRMNRVDKESFSNYILRLRDQVFRKYTKAVFTETLENQISEMKKYLQNSTPEKRNEIASYKEKNKQLLEKLQQDVDEALKPFIKSRMDNMISRYNKTNELYMDCLDKLFTAISSWNTLLKRLTEPQVKVMEIMEVNKRLIENLKNIVVQEMDKLQSDVFESQSNRKNNTDNLSELIKSVKVSLESSHKDTMLKAIGVNKNVRNGLVNALNRERPEDIVELEKAVQDVNKCLFDLNKVFQEFQVTKSRISDLARWLESPSAFEVLSRGES